MRTPKTKEVKVIQGSYAGGPWYDEAVYDKKEYGNIRHDLAEYIVSSRYCPIIYRVITRRVPIND